MINKNKNVQTFMFNGIKYPVNTFVVVTEKCKKSARYKWGGSNIISKVVESYEMSGIKYITISLQNEYGTNILYTIKENEANEYIASIVSSYTNNINNNTNEEKVNDIDIDIVFYGWVAYILFMLFGLVLKNGIMLMAIATICFFAWRNSQIVKYNNNNK